MKHKRLPALIMSLLMLLPFAGCAQGQTEESSKPTIEITVFSIGKADSILVRTGDNTMLIDCGEESDEEYILSELEKRSITHLDVLQITHFDKDHVGSAAAVAGKLDIDKIIYPDYEGTRSEYSKFMQAIEGHSDSSAVSEIISGALGEAQYTVYPAESPENYYSDDSEYDNEMSLVTKLSFGSKTFLFTGDAEKKRLKSMIKQDVDWSCDWIKLPHHGRYCKQLSGFLSQCAPTYSVMTISSAEPAEDDTIALLKELNIQSFDTLSGNVVTVCDGETITVKNESTEEG